MRTLYLIRHAKSSKDDPSLKDFDRPLNARGERTAPFMAQMFLHRNEAVDLLVSSPALRALQTAQFFATTLSVPHDRITQDREIYLAGVEDLMSVVNGLPDGAQRVMIFGHNPGFTELLEHLCHATAGDLPTCGMARIDLNARRWQDVKAGTGSLAWLDLPRQHAGIA